MARPLHAHLSLPALRANVARAKELAPNAEILAVVKADAYGHGLMRVLPGLDEAAGLALVELDTALKLRAARYTKRILLLEGFFTRDELPEISHHRLAVVVHNDEQLQMLERTRLVQPVEVFIKINTGMNRLGIPMTDVVKTVERLNNCPSVAVLRLMTHFARADEDYGIEKPLAAFNAACRGMPYPRSLANSAGVVRYGEIGGEIVRPGIMLYGATPFATEPAASIGVRPVMTLRSEIIAVQALEPGATVGYGGSYTATRSGRIGVVACGYADGYPRHAPYGTPVLVQGKRARLAGRVSMDMLTVDITELPEAGIGSPVTLWGEGLPVDEVAHAAQTVGYELLCGITMRVPFIVSNVERVDFEI
jgi:alanine racemase